MTICAVFGCSANSQRDKGVPFYTFPKEIKLKKLWIHATCRKEFSPNKYSKICGHHFPLGLRNKNDIPTLNLPKPFQTTSSPVKVCD